MGDWWRSGWLLARGAHRVWRAVSRSARHASDFSGPLPLVVEVWSSSTSDYDGDTKLSDYQQRGDLEIWRIHPYERTLTSWQRQPDGSYQETIHRSGSVTPIGLPGVTIDLKTLWDP
jgi:Uma2 family endonuclease